MRRRHVAPRHRAPRSTKRLFRRAAVDLAGVLGSLPTKRTTAVLATVGLAAGTGLVVIDRAYAARPPAYAASLPTRALHREAAALVAQHGVLTNHVSSERELSRSAERLAPSELRPVAKNAPPATAQDVSGARTETVAPPTPREIGMSLLSSYGWDSGQFSCLDSLWTRESNWNPRASNSTSGAYGIPQALPGAKMAASGRDWATNPVTQIKWGLWYIRASYGSPCGAWYFWESHSWY